MSVALGWAKEGGDWQSVLFGMHVTNSKESDSSTDS